MHGIGTLPEPAFYAEYSRLWMRAYTPLTWDGAKRITRIMKRASPAQRRILGRAALTVFPRIAHGGLAQRGSLGSWLRFATGRADTTVRTERECAEQLPSLRPEVLQFAPEGTLDGATRRRVAVGRRLRVVGGGDV